MKIDIHVHTKKCKQGDALTREIEPERFGEIISSTDVQILCITNHNVFDLDQFEKIEAVLDDNTQVWPGVELDIIENSIRSHLLVIVSPEQAQNFSDSVLDITNGDDPDSFNTTLANTLKHFDHYGPLYIAHYKQKKPAMPENSIEALIEGTANPSRVIKEVSNSISAGIYISHGHPSIYGSDVQVWDEYAESHSKDLPDLRLPVESFNHFCLLLEKDPTTINTLLDKKTSEDLELYPFDDGAIVKLKAYNDINVLFGSKGTGKSCILKAIAKHYREKGMTAEVFTPASDELSRIYGVNNRDIDINLTNFGIKYCNDEIKSVRKAIDVDITSLSNYVSFFRDKSSNRNAKKILLKDIGLQPTGMSKRKFNEYSDSSSNVESFIMFLDSDESVKEELKDSERQTLLEILTTLQGRLSDGNWKFFSTWKETFFLNSAIETFGREIQRKTGNPSKPSKTGFIDYAKNRIDIEKSINEIVKNICIKIKNQEEEIGSLGENKGVLSFQLEVKVQDGTINDGNLQSSKSIKKNTQKNFSRAIKKIAQRIYEDDLFQHITDLNEIDDVDDIKTIFELLQFKRFFSLDNEPYEPYEPSSGEASMVMLHRELAKDKDIYILDEPERSLGNEYINDVIVPLLKERARAGKRVFISTHDANIAVRTLPYSSVYRTHGPEGYDTFIGNPFTNNLINVTDSNQVMNWKLISMKTLEGGEEAFGERGKIYGNS